jgi:hypothetical protein
MPASKIEIKDAIATIVSSASAYFDKCHTALGEKATQNWLEDRTDYFWSDIPEHLMAESEELRQQIISLTQKALLLCRGSVLINDADVFEVKIIAKRLFALLRLREYFYYTPEVIHDEGTVLGFQQSSQEERSPQTPRNAARLFRKAAEELFRIVDLTDNEVSPANDSKEVRSKLGAYRHNSAFVMMWMDTTKPELEDVRDAVVEIFRNFGIVAVRADDIEHEGVITQRVLSEIRTSEFLFADLSGARPNVYYEVGYAHALGKRVILFRRTRTGMHFDLAGYNCPEYENIRDLKHKLTKRLEVLVNRTAGRDVADATIT